MENIFSKNFQMPKFGHGVYAIIYRNFNSFLKNWKQISFEFVLQPSLYLISFGYFLTKIVVAPGVDNYAAFLFQGLLYATCFSTCFFESNIGIRERLLSKKSQYSLSIAPVEYSQIVFGEYIWSVLMSMLASSLFLLVGLALQLVTIVQLFPILSLCFLIALISSALGFWLNSGLLDKINVSNPVLFLVLPFFLFSGVFYPTNFFPNYISNFFDVLPLGFAISLAREQNFQFSSLDYGISILYLVFSFVLLGLTNSRLHERALEDLDAMEED